MVIRTKDHRCSSQWYYQIRMADTCYYVSKAGYSLEIQIRSADERYESHPRQRKEHITFFEISSGAMCVTHTSAASASREPEWNVRRIARTRRMSVYTLVHGIHGYMVLLMIQRYIHVQNIRACLKRPLLEINMAWWHHNVSMHQDASGRRYFYTNTADQANGHHHRWDRQLEPPGAIMPDNALILY